MADIVETLEGKFVADLTDLDTLPCIGERVKKNGHMYKVIDVVCDLDTGITTYTVVELF